MKKICIRIENPEHGDETLEQPVEDAKETVKQQCVLGKFGVTDKNEIIDIKTPDKEMEEKVESSKEITFHEKRKPG